MFYLSSLLKDQLIFYEVSEIFVWPHIIKATQFNADALDMQHLRDFQWFESHWDIKIQILVVGVYLFS